MFIEEETEEELPVAELTPWASESGYDQEVDQDSSDDDIFTKWSKSVIEYQNETNTKVIFEPQRKSIVNNSSGPTLRQPYHSKYESSTWEQKAEKSLIQLQRSPKPKAKNLTQVFNYTIEEERNSKTSFAEKAANKYKRENSNTEKYKELSYKSPRSKSADTELSPKMRKNSDPDELTNMSSNRSICTQNIIKNDDERTPFKTEQLLAQNTPTSTCKSWVFLQEEVSNLMKAKSQLKSKLSEVVTDFEKYKVYIDRPKIAISWQTEVSGDISNQTEYETILNQLEEYKQLNQKLNMQIANDAEVNFSLILNNFALNFE